MTTKKNGFKKDNKQLKMKYYLHSKLILWHTLFRDHPCSTVDQNIGFEYT